MRLPLTGHARCRQRVGVRTDRDPWGARDLADVLLAHRRDQDPRRASVGEEEVAHGVQGVDPPSARDFTERAAGVSRLMR